MKGRNTRVLVLEPIDLVLQWFKYSQKSFYSSRLLFVYKKALIPVFWLQYNLCEFTARIHKFKRLFRKPNCGFNRQLSDLQIKIWLRFDIGNSIDTHSFNREISYLHPISGNALIFKTNISTTVERAIFKRL